MPIFLIAKIQKASAQPVTPTFFELHSQKNILCEWYSYLETVTLGRRPLVNEGKYGIKSIEKTY